MRKILALILSLVIAFSVAGSSFAAKQEMTEAPIIIVPGFLQTNLQSTDEKGKTVKVWFPDIGDNMSIIFKNMPQVIKGFFGAFGENPEMLGSTLMHTLSELMPMMKCEPDGSSSYPVFPYENLPEKRSFSAIKRDESIHMQGYYTFMDYICRNGYADADNVFVFEYDGRMDALTLSEELRSFIKDVKEYTEKDRVRLLGVSYGGQILETYLHFYYGEADVEKAVFSAPTFKGTSFAYRLLSGNVDFALDDVIDIAESMMGSDTELNKVLKDVNQKRFSRIICGVTPGISEYAKYWGAAYSMSRTQEYEVLKEMFLDKNESAELIRKNDIIHYQVMPQVKNTLEKCIKKGIGIAIYACSGIELALGGKENSDLLLSVTDVTGALATPVGKRFSDGYKGKGTACNNSSHRHISPSMEIDASTAYLPENTWFSDGSHHAMFQYEKYASELHARLLCTDEIKDVHSSPEFPQFMYSTNPHRGIIAFFDISAPGYISASDSRLVIENLYKNNSVKIYSVTGDGMEFQLDNPISLMPGERTELMLKNPLSTEKSKKASVVIRFIKQEGFNTDIIRKFDFTVTGNDTQSSPEIIDDENYDGGSSGMNFFKRILYTFVYVFDVIPVIRAFLGSDAFRYLL